jgi:hypothetical protein
MMNQRAQVPDSERTSGITLSLKRMLAGTALPGVAFGLMAVFTTAANATTYDYTLTPGTYGFPGPNSETISGSFSIAGSDMVSIDLTVTGTGTIPDGTYSVVDQFYGSNSIIFATDTATESTVISFEFSSPLTGEVDPISLLEIGTGCLLDVGCASVENASSYPAGAEAVPATPEPSSIALFGTGFALFGLLWLRKPRRRFLSLRVV